MKPANKWSSQMKASTLAKEYGIKLGDWHTGNNGAKVLPLTISKRDFDGMVLVSYKVIAEDGRWLDGDSTPNTLYYWIGGGK
jgi:hypothetical protein